MPSDTTDRDPYALFTPEQRRVAEELEVKISERLRTALEPKEQKQDVVERQREKDAFLAEYRKAVDSKPTRESTQLRLDLLTAKAERESAIVERDAARADVEVAKQRTRDAWAAQHRSHDLLEAMTISRDEQMGRAEEAESELDAARKERDEARSKLAEWDDALNVQIDRAEIAERKIESLEARQQSHLETIRRITQETPLPEEVAAALEQRGALLAEVGTLRSRVADLERELALKGGIK